jgi:hypothetical protein
LGSEGQRGGSVKIKGELIVFLHLAMGQARKNDQQSDFQKKFLTRKKHLTPPCPGFRLQKAKASPTKFCKFSAKVEKTILNDYGKIIRNRQLEKRSN